MMRWNDARRVASGLIVGLLALAAASLPACRRTGEVNSSGGGAGLSWTWEGGSNAVGGPPVYGTLGSGVSGNKPGARDSAATWIDGQGNFWLFGGYGIDSSGNATASRLNDLWQYNSGSAIWTWIGGANLGGNAGSYGTQGQAAAGNQPPALNGAVAWADQTGNLWLFGGLSGRGNLNDLWKYTPSGVSGQWTWMSGSNAGQARGVYGTQGSAGQGTNLPGGRSFASGWIDTNNRLWLFGGVGVDGSGNSGNLNDLWMYDPSNRNWIWMGGSNLINGNGVYTATSSTAAVPGARQGATTWVDAAGTFWLFGGAGYPATGANGLLNDLWQLDPATLTWKFVGGSMGVDTLAIYGTQGIGGAANVPESRENALGWIDSQGRLLLFGGSGWDTTAAQSTAEEFELNDVWRFDPASSQWSWLGGPQLAATAGSYGTLGKQSAGSTPGARSKVPAWKDPAGNLWIFGGYGADATAIQGELGDLWQAITP